MHLDKSFISLISAEENLFQGSNFRFLFCLDAAYSTRVWLGGKRRSSSRRICKKYWKIQNILCFWELMPSMAQGCWHCIYNSIQKDCKKQNDKMFWRAIAPTDLILSRVFTITSMLLSEISLKQWQSTISTMMKFSHPSLIAMFCQTQAGQRSHLCADTTDP